jgi:UDP-2-acetamido-3-amino-2,3-dideoxy-glucuronate N-acetyltransferase
MSAQLRLDPRFTGVRVHASSYLDEDIAIGEGTTIWHFCHVLPGAVIGKHCSIGQNVMIGRNVTIGDGCRIQNNVSVYEGVVLEDDVFCGPSCVFTNVVNPRAFVSRKAEFKTTLVKRDVPDLALVAGVPAARIGWMSRAGERLGPDLVCPRDGSRYREIAPDRLELSPGPMVPMAGMRPSPH